MLVEEAVLVCQYGGIIRVKEVSNTTKKKSIDSRRLAAFV